jgi:hypothetical protein
MDSGIWLADRRRAQDKHVAMNHNRRAPLPLSPRWLFHKTSKGLTTKGAQATGHFTAVLIKNQHGLIRLELPCEIRNPHQKQGGAFVAERLAGTAIDLQAALRLQSMGQPAFSMAKGLGMGMKDRASAPSRQHGFKHLLITTIRQMHGDPTRSSDPSGRELRGHPAGSPTAAISCALFKVLQFCWVMHVQNWASRCITAWIRGIQAVDIGQKNQIVRIYRCCY